MPGVPSHLGLVANQNLVKDDNKSLVCMSVAGFGDPTTDVSSSIMGSALETGNMSEKEKVEIWKKESCLLFSMAAAKSSVVIYMYEDTLKGDQLEELVNMSSVIKGNQDHHTIAP